MRLLIVSLGVIWCSVVHEEADKARSGANVKNHAGGSLSSEILNKSGLI